MRYNPTRGLKRSDVLLLLIEDHCHPDGRYWVPQSGSDYCARLRTLIDVYGPGDAAALRSLERHGYIQREGEHIGYSITEDGLLYASTLEAVRS